MSLSWGDGPHIRYHMHFETGINLSLRDLYFTLIARICVIRSLGVTSEYCPPCNTTIKAFLGEERDVISIQTRPSFATEKYGYVIQDKGPVPLLLSATSPLSRYISFPLYICLGSNRQGSKRIGGWVNHACSRLSTMHGHITDCKLDSVVYAGVCVWVNVDLSCLGRTIYNRQGNTWI